MLHTLKNKILEKLHIKKFSDEDIGFLLAGLVLLNNRLDNKNINQLYYRLFDSIDIYYKY